MAQLARAAYHQSHRFGLKGGLRDSGIYDPAGTFSNACQLPRSRSTSRPAG